MSALSDSIEQFLLKQGGWVDSDALCLAFGLPDDRDFRQTGDKPGLCSAFAISGQHGFRHIDHATEAEWQHFSAKMRNHSIHQLRRIAILRKRRKTIKPQLEMAL